MGIRGIAVQPVDDGNSELAGPAAVWTARLYPDGRGACRGQGPLRRGMQVTMDDDLIIWLTKDLVS